MILVEKVIDVTESPTRGSVSHGDFVSSPTVYIIPFDPVIYRVLYNNFLF